MCQTRHLTCLQARLAPPSPQYPQIRASVGQTVLLLALPFHLPCQRLLLFQPKNLRKAKLQMTMKGL